jgi:hypothetical protein
MSPLIRLKVCTLTYGVFLLSCATMAQPAFAEVLISVNKSTQQMSVSVDGVPRYRFAVSTGRAGYGTPNGTYHPQRLAERAAVTIQSLIDEAEQARIKAMESQNGAAAAVSAITAKAKLAGLWREKPEQTNSGPVIVEVNWPHMK